jgi:arginase
MHVPVTAAGRTRTIVAIEVPCGAGARDPRCKDGPAAFRQYWNENASPRDPQLVWDAMPHDLCGDGIAPAEAVARTCRWLAATTRRLAQDGSRFVAIGGDHSIAMGTWSGVASALRSSGPLGLIWIDAHMDMHVPETTHTGAIHGMPIAALLGYGAPAFTTLAGKQSAIAPRHICLVGARSFEPEEVAFARHHGVRVIGMDECLRRGMKDVFAEARAIASDGTIGYGVSLDLDAFDPADAPGVGTPAPNGIRASEFLDHWASLINTRACRGVEIVEYNPFRDEDARTARLMSTLVGAIARA